MAAVHLNVQQTNSELEESNTPSSAPANLTGSFGGHRAKRRYKVPILRPSSPTEQLDDNLNGHQGITEIRECRLDAPAKSDSSNDDSLVTESPHVLPVPIHTTPHKENLSPSLGFQHDPLELHLKTPKSQDHTNQPKTFGKSGLRHTFAPAGDLVYPGIPFQVAQCLQYSNPDVLNHLEATLNEERSRFQNRSLPSPDQPLSVLHHMMNAADALALQESVIGLQRLPPASPEVVAEVVAKTRNIMSSEASKSISFVHDQPESCNQPSEAVEPTRVTKGPETPKELHRVPPERISMVVERRSWFSSGSSKDEHPMTPVNSVSAAHMHQVEHNINPQPPNLHDVASPVIKQDDLQMKNADVAKSGVKSAMQGINDKIETHSNFSELDSVSSERFELESNVSDRFEVQSTFSDVSGMEEEMFRIKKLLLDVTPCSDTSSITSDLHVGRSVFPADNSRGHLIDQAAFFEVQRQNANMQGQLEAMRNEVEMAAREQAQVSSLRTQLAAQSALARSATAEKESSKKQLEILERKVLESSAEIARMHSLRESRDSEVERLREEFRDSEASCAHLRVSFEELKVDLELRDGAVRGLKSKVAEMHVELEAAMQGKIRAENLVSGLKSEVESLRKAKEWYTEQLHSAQTARGRAQQEVITLQGNLATEMASAERSKLENSRLRAQLSDMQQRIVKEKEALARRLQAIEADMMEREAAFEQIQRDNGTTELVLAQKMKRVDEERARMSSLALQMADLQHQLEVVLDDNRVKAELVAVLEKELSENVKRLIVAQEGLSERDLGIHRLEERRRTLEGRVKELEADLVNRDSQLSSLKENKVTLELELTAARKEKREVEDSLSEIQSNVQKLESRFRRMREELALKSASVERLETERNQLDDDLRVREQHLLALRRGYENYSNDLQNRDGRLQGLEEEKSFLGKELDSLREESGHWKNASENAEKTCKKLQDEIGDVVEKLNKVSAEFEVVVAEKGYLEERIHVLENFNMSDTTRIDLGKKLGKELSEVKNALLQKEEQLKMVTIENLKLEDRLMAQQDDAKHGSRSNLVPFAREQEVQTDISKDVILNHSHFSDQDGGEVVKQLIEEKRLLEKRISHLKSDNERLSNVILCEDDSMTVSKPLPTTFARLEKELMIETLSSHERKEIDGMLTHLDCQVQTEFSSVDSAQEIEKVKELLMHTENSLKEREKNHRDQHRRYESNIKVLTRKLKELIRSKKKLEEEVKELREKERLMDSIEKPPERQSGRDRSRDAKLLYLKKKVIILENRLSELQLLYEDENRRANRNEELALELERQKGQLHSVAEINSVLRQHTNKLESVHVTHSEEGWQEKEAKPTMMTDDGLLKEKLLELEGRLNAELGVTKELRGQIFNEKRVSSSLRKQLQSLKMGLDQANQLAETKTLEVRNLSLEVEKLQKLDGKLHGEIENSKRALLSANAEIDRLKMILEDCRAKDPVLADQIKSMSWHLHQKGQEIAAMKERHKLVVERLQTDLDAVHRALRETKDELDMVKLELQNIMREKFSYQSKVSELRAALKACVEHSKVLKEQMLPKGSEHGLNSSETSLHSFSSLSTSPVPYDESFINSLLLQSATLPQSKPLNNLQECLNTLKQEMSILQKRLQEHSDGAFNSERI